MRMVSFKIPQSERYLEPFLRYANIQEGNKESNRIANRAYKHKLEERRVSQNLEKITLGYYRHQKNKNMKKNRNLLEPQH